MLSGACTGILFWFICFITSDHKIYIGDQIFWDWEDHFIKKL
jgi:hypothetical protein